jgi:UDP-N-acetyl-D-mannosaminuronic acid dehydrogenase
VDPWFLVEAAPDITPLIRTARIVNDAQPQFVLDLVRKAVGNDLAGKRVAALGLSYKPDVDDLRESPAIEVAHLLVEAGCQVRAFEPCKPEAVIEGLTTVATLEAALRDSEVLLLLVGHSVFRGLHPQAVAQMTQARLVIDTVNGWPADEWKEAGFKVYRLGVGG